MYSLLRFLNATDHSLTALLNFDGGTAMDYLWWCFSSRLLWLLPSVGFIYALLRRRKGAVFVLTQVCCIALVVFLCDHTTSAMFKPLFMRLRPSHDGSINGMLHYVNDYHGGLYGFMSSHAANAFGVWAYVSRMFRRRAASLLLLLLACLVAYSRIYLGVHFLGDIVCGGIFGALVGGCIGMAARSLSCLSERRKDSFRHAIGFI